MSGFDLRTLNGFRPPRCLCEKCLALFPAASEFLRKQNRPVCPVCKVQYVPTEGSSPWQITSYLTQRGFVIKHDDLLQHCIRLAATAPVNGRATLRTLFQALSRARYFVHFATYGISYPVIGALKLIAQSIPVRGIVSNVNADTAAELTEFTRDTPAGNFEMKLFATTSAARDVPHQKLVVIDGLLGFKGSANLTVPGWRKAEQGLDIIEVVTDVDDFSPVWGQVSHRGMTIDMDDAPF